MKNPITFLLAALVLALANPASAAANRCSSASSLQIHGQTLVFAKDEEEKKKKKGEGEEEEEPDCE